jgi:type IV secretion system protein VirD4
VLEGKERDKNILSGLEQAHFQSQKELNKNFAEFEFDKLKNKAVDGVVIKAEQVKSKLKVNLSKPTHTLVIGTTGSGKTTMYVTPSIQLLSSTKSKPSMVISDPKGELYDLHSEHLKNMGYDVKVIDLREPDKSSKWNPLDRAWDMWQRAHNLQKEVKIYKDVKPKDVNKNLKIIRSKDYKEVWYEFNRTAYPDKETLRQDAKALKSKLKTEAINDIDDISITLAPVGNQQDPMWVQGAQDFIKAVLIAMLEDSLIPETGMTKDKFNFYNLEKIASKRDIGSDDIFETLKKYFFSLL